MFAFKKEVEPVSEEERLKCVRYFIELNDNKVCNLQRLLYLAIINCDFKVTELLRKRGIKIPQNACKILIGGGEEYPYSFSGFCNKIKFMTAEEFVWSVTELSKDLDKNKSVAVNTQLLNILKKGAFYEPVALDQIIAHFDTKKISKSKTMQDIILRDSPELLSICEKHGWLKMPRKRDEMIKFAADNEKTECTAWLLEIKKRTADLTEEQEKAEKKLMRELNANPNSVTELKKLWGFEKREDGSIIITRYKGKQTEIVVPEKIGNGIVKEIAEYAFSPRAPRLTKKQKEFRKSVTKITLPETVEVIWQYAFCDCYGLSSINIPEAVKSIENGVFVHCASLFSVNIPQKAERIRSHAF
ncbi:MAG: leucine-rich repeat domain-containing protein, partial [Ruminiclostridium sp.]|nr:leucine-rich repeat domain-containing protein [Ruminiclostridium sp.]